MKKFLSVFLVLAMIFSTCTFALPGNIVATEDAGEKTSTEPETAKEDKATSQDDFAFLENAQLIYSEDFSEYATDTVIPKNQTVSPYFVADGYKALYGSDNNSNGLMTVKQDGNGNKYLNFEKKSRWDMLTIYFPDDLKQIGTYYFVGSFYFDSDAYDVFSDPAQMTVYTNGKGGDGHLSQSYRDGQNSSGWVKCVRKIDVVGQSAAEEAGVTFTDGVGSKYNPVAWIDKMYYYSSSKANDNCGNLKIDDFALYFVPAEESIETVTVSFDKNTSDATAVAPDAITIDKMSTFKPGDFAATTETDKVFKGWSKEPGGALIKEANLFATDDMTLYAVWEGKYTVPGYDWEMPAAPFDKLDCNTGTVSVTLVEDGDVTAMKIAQETKSTTSSATLTKDGTEAPAKYYGAHDPFKIVNTSIPASAVTAIEYRVKFVTPYAERKGGSGFQTFYITDTKGISEGRSFTFNCIGDGEYHTYIKKPTDLADWNGTIKQLRFDPLNDYYEDEAVYIDYIKLYTGIEIPTEVTEGIVISPASGSTVDYRNPAIQVKFPFYPKATPDAVAAAYGMSGGKFDPDTNTYTIYPSSQNLSGKTFSSNGGVVFGDGANYMLPPYTISYTEGMADDGENIMPNGNFDYSWKNWTSSGIRYESEGVMTSFSTSTGNIFNSTKPVSLVFTPGTDENPNRYYIEYRARLNGNSYKDLVNLRKNKVYDANGAQKDFPYPGINVYWPKEDGKYTSNGNNTSTWECPTYIKGLSKDGLNTGFTNDVWVTKSAVFDYKSLEFYGISSFGGSFQCVTNGGPYYYDAEKTQPAYYSTGGFAVDFDYVIVKQMYAINFESGAENTTGDGVGPYYYAKGNTIILPVDSGFVNGDMGFAGWEYNGKIYAPGEEITFDTTGNITMTAKWAAGITYTYNGVEVPVGTLTFPYTIPSSVEGIAYTGEKAENFILDYWTFGTEKYAPGTVFTKEQETLIKGKTLTAVFADKTQPAMGYASEGTDDVGVGIQKMETLETTTDGGLTVLKTTWSSKNTFNSSSKTYANDVRIGFTLPEKAGTDFNQFRIRYKIQNAVLYNYDSATGEHIPTVMEKGSLRGYFSGTRSLYSESQRFLSGNGINDGKYYVHSKNLLENTHLTDGFIPQGGVKFFWIDPCLSNGGEAYIDYLRLYRGGIHSVKYNTNAPVGTTATYEVPADTDMGIGTGYLLSGDEPVLDNSNYVFAGWALTSDAGISDVVSAVDLEGDLEVYGVWTELDAPVADTATEIRIPDAETVQGLRFAAKVTAEQKESATEYGYIVALTDGLAENELTFDYTGKYVYGAAYIKDGGLDKIYAMDGTDTIFTGVLTNVPKSQYRTSITARPYMKVNFGGKIVTVYGDAVTTSVFDTANAVLDAVDAGTLEMTEDQIEFLLAIVG